jgi:hypothetical protein
MSTNSMLGHHYKVRVVLTATSNAFLADRLPLAGELEVLEMTTDGRITPGKAVFRVANPDGTLSVPVHVEDIEFTYSAHRERDRPTSAFVTNHRWVAMHYVWGQQDATAAATGNTSHRDSGLADEFGRKYTAGWQLYIDDQIPRMTSLSSAYENFLRDRTIWPETECAACGRWMQPADYDTDRAVRGADAVTDSPAGRRCQRCHSQPTKTTP